MSETAIKVEDLSKVYRIGARQEGYKTIRETVSGAVAGPFRRLFDGRSRSPGGILPRDDTIWALKDVSFEVKRGEVLGVIGRNGAGKTTLLKILSRITEPTAGSATIYGRLGSLLEVGTGFHPELTGRENVFLNGAILGMKKTEIERKFDEIVAFAELDRFIDTPVKRYSSGMYVRLAFAVAAHLEPEILLVDEVLAVGDAAFQRKCLQRMGEVSREGKTVLFVSHNMGAIAALCGRAIVIDGGRLKLDSPSTEEAIASYLSSLEQLADADLRNRADRGGDQMARYTGIWFEDRRGLRIGKAVTGQFLAIGLRYESELRNPKLDFAIGIYGTYGDSLIHCSTRYSVTDSNSLPSSGDVLCVFPKVPLPPGRYRVNLSIHHLGERVDHVLGATMLEMEPGDFYGTGKIPPAIFSKVLVDHSWLLPS